MDNAGDHGTDKYVKQYKNMLLTEFNIEIIHQVPRSPFTNFLDLGVYAGFQAAVDRCHFMKQCNVESLVCIINDTWEMAFLIVSSPMSSLNLKRLYV